MKVNSFRTVSTYSSIVMFLVVLLSSGIANANMSKPINDICYPMENSDQNNPKMVYYSNQIEMGHNTENNAFSIGFTEPLYHIESILVGFFITRCGTLDVFEPISKNNRLKYQSIMKAVPDTTKQS